MKKVINDRRLNRSRTLPLAHGPLASSIARWLTPICLVLPQIITAGEYTENVAERADESRRTVRQHRMAFLYDNTHHEIYVYKKPCHGLSLLLVQVFSDDANPLLPPFLPIGQEVTGKNEYSAYQLSVCEEGEIPHVPKRGMPREAFSPRSVPLPGRMGDDGNFAGDDFAGDGFAL